MLVFVPMLGTMALVLGLALAAATGSEHVSAIGVAIVGALIVSFISKLVVTDEDKNWLPTFILAGYTAKILASWLRWWILVDFYNGSGDAVGYHGKALSYVHDWRAFSPPPMRIGTEAMEGITGLVYFPYVPNFLGGFFMFATIAFFGQILLYAAFRKSVVPRRLKLYAIAIFFVPNVVYWPSSIGKESLMLLGIGAGAYGIAKLLNDGSMSSLFSIAAGLGLAGFIRPHVAAMMAVGATVALLFAKGEGVARFPGKRLFLLAFVGAGLAVALFFTASNFGITVGAAALEDGQVDEFLGTVEDNTSKGGSAVEGGFISSPLEFPDATMRVLFRPFPNEAHNPPALASSLEGTLLLLIMIWKLPAMIKRGVRIRRDPYILFSLVFTVAFIIAFSSFLNLGLMARERSQVMPFVLAILVALGFGPPDDEDDDEEPELNQFGVPVGTPLVAGPVSTPPTETQEEPAWPAGFLPPARG